MSFEGGRGGEVWGTHACFAWSSVGGRGSGVELSDDVGTPRFGVQWGSVGRCEVIGDGMGGCCGGSPRVFCVDPRGGEGERCGAQW